MSAGAAALGLCLALAAQQRSDALPPPARFIAATSFTLAWTHSIEKTRWEEDYRAEPGQPPTLRLLAARIRGSGAGMEPPAGSVLKNGWYEYVPSHQPQGPLRLTRSAYTADYEWCEQGNCQPFGQLLPSDGGVTLMWACNGR